VLVTDEQRLQQILKNLLSNAFKFTGQGEVALTLELVDSPAEFQSEALVRAGQAVAFRVSDTGIGMPADKLRLIFEAFQQADGGTSRRYGGTGLGLSISREIARLLGGEIHVQSVEGQGSTFTLYLPLDYRWAGGRSAAMALLETPSKPVAESVTVGALANGSAAHKHANHPEPALLQSNELGDDRDAIQPGDRVILVIEDNEPFARTLLESVRDHGFKTLVAMRGDTGLALAHELRPDAILLDLKLPVTDGLTVLDHLKHHPETRHIPIYVLSGLDQRQEAMRAGALAYREKPVSTEELSELLASIASFVERRVKRLLVVDDDDVERQSIVELIGGGGDDVDITAVGTSEDALAALEGEGFDCMVLDLKLPDGTGYELLESLKRDVRLRDLPVIVHTGKELTRKEETALKQYAETIVVKDVHSPERLLDETSLFLHRVEARLPAEKRRMLEQLHSADAVFEGKKVLVVDDDVRNVFALASALERIEVLFAENGRDGIESLRENPDVDLVLMDVMMPEMDGYQTTRAIREMPDFSKLPIISLTAKAMKGDREKSILSGASDYITKPVDTDQLLSLMRVWLYR